MKYQHYTEMKDGKETGRRLDIQSDSKSAADDIAAYWPCQPGAEWAWAKEVEAPPKKKA